MPPPIVHTINVVLVVCSAHQLQWPPLFWEAVTPPTLSPLNGVGARTGG